MAYEKVHSVWDYYDGPRSGVADFNGQPHHYSCIWDDRLNDFELAFTLTPVDAKTLALTLEKESIWRAWEEAFHCGKVPEESHPGIAGRHPRYTELKAELDRRIAKVPPRCRAQATFRPRAAQPDRPPGVIRELEVSWDFVSEC